MIGGCMPESSAAGLGEKFRAKKQLYANTLFTRGRDRENLGDWSIG